MSKKKKKGGEEEETGESAPLWIVSFADLVVLLMSFFVIMSAGNPKNIAFDPEFADVVAAIKKAFKYIPPAGSTDPIDMRILMGALKSKAGKNKDKGTTGKKGEADQHITGVTGKDDLVTTVRVGTQTTIGGVIPFAKDSSELTSETLPILMQIAEQIRGHTNVFHVKGHTSSDEEYRLRGVSRDLAFERATAVVIRLIALGIPAKSLRPQSCRAFEPLKEGVYSEAALSVNRRVEVIATESLVSEFRGERPHLPAQTDEVLTKKKGPE